MIRTSDNCIIIGGAFQAAVKKRASAPFYFYGKTAGERLTNPPVGYIITNRYITNAIWRDAHAGGETDFEG